jgi:CRP/FNR family transcriptional regulator, nitrogen fixation regulation protein
MKPRNGSNGKASDFKSHPTSPYLKALEDLATTMSCHRGQEIAREGGRAEHWYCLLAGAARCYVIRLDGRRQIVDLLLPGDCFGFTAASEYDCSVEAVADDTVVASYPRRRAEMLADSDPQIARQIRQATFEALSRLQSQLLILGRVTAVEKVSSFILEMKARLTKGRNDRVALPLSRYDIADYLAVSVETVSRSLTDLKHRGLIRFSGTRTLEIMDPEALEDGDSLSHLPVIRQGEASCSAAWSGTAGLPIHRHAPAGPT